MANTTKLIGMHLHIKGLDVDWAVPGDLPGMLPAGLRVKSIQFNPSAASDVCIIKAGLPTQKTTAAAIATTSTATELFHATAAGANDEQVKYFGDRGAQMWPFIDISDWTLSSASAASLLIELA